MWRRSYATAVCCRALAGHLQRPDPERFYLAGLLCDIGVLVLDTVVPALYAPLRAQPVSAGRLREIEQDALGVDHGPIGAWLLERWRLPACFRIAVMHGHAQDLAEVPASHRALAGCTAVAAAVADVWWRTSWRDLLEPSVEGSQRLLGIDGATLLGVLETAHAPPANAPRSAWRLSTSTTSSRSTTVLVIRSAMK